MNVYLRVAVERMNECDRITTLYGSAVLGTEKDFHCTLLDSTFYRQIKVPCTGINSIPRIYPIYQHLRSNWITKYFCP